MDAIAPTSILFTPETIIISESISFPLESSCPYFVVEITPTKNRKDIQSIKLWYFNDGLRLNDEITDIKFFQSVTHSIQGNANNLTDKTAIYMKSISDDDLSLIIKEYSKYIQDGVVIDGFIAGLGTYVAFLLLNENNLFSNHLPFQFSIPANVRNGHILNRNMFQYLSLPLSSMLKISRKLLLQISVFLHNFINIWEPLFISGPNISPSTQGQLAVNIISGFSQTVFSSLAQIQTIESRLQNHLDDALAKMRREFNNLMIETRTTNNINMIKSLIENEMTSYRPKSDNEEIRLMISDLENKITNLYAKFESNNSEQIISNETNPSIMVSEKEPDNSGINDLRSKVIKRNNHWSRTNTFSP